jgi:ATP-dependent exoDNAse (exonuclease V) beta subunit
VELSHSDQLHRDRFCREIDKNFSVIASAGAGKTRAVVDRIVTIAVDGPEELLPRLVVVTFTNNSASEFKRRVRSALLEKLRSDSVRAVLQRLEQTFFGTIHSFCIRLLREYQAHLGLPDEFTVLTDPIRDRLWLQFTGNPEFSRPFAENPLVREVLRFCIWQDLLDLAARISQPSVRRPVSASPPDIDLTPLEQCSVRKQVEQRKEQLLNDLSRFRAGVINGEPGLVIPEAKSDAQGLTEAFRAAIGPIVKWLEEASLAVASEIAGKFQDNCIRQGFITFDGQIALCRRLLNNAVVLDSLRSRNHSVILDEAQDTTASMFEILIEITRARGEAVGSWPGTGSGPLPGRFTMVGDPRQSIYEKAAPEYYRGLNEAFLKNDSGELLRFLRTKRCDVAIVETVNRVFSNALIGDAEIRYDDLEADDDAKPGHAGSIKIATVDSGAKLKVEEIFVRECAGLSEWLRKQDKQSLGIGSWSQVAIIAPRHDWLSICADQLSRSAIPFVYRNRRINWNAVPVFTWPVAVLYTLANPWDTFERLGVLREIFGVPDTALAAWRQNPREIAPELAAATEVLNGLDAVVRDDKSITLARLVERIINDCRLESRLHAAGYDRSDLCHMRHRGYQADIEKVSLNAWVEELVTLLDQSADVQTASADAVELITSHSAKGLEWDIVIPIGFGRRIFAGGRTAYPQLVETVSTHRVVWNAESAGTGPADSQECLLLRAANRRLLYVTLTRARHGLLIPAIAYNDSKDSFSDATNFNVEQISECLIPLPSIARTEQYVFEQLELPMDSVDFSLAARRSREAPELVRPHALAKDDEMPERQFIEDDPASFHYGRWWHLWVERFPWCASANEQKQYVDGIERDLPFAERAIQETTEFLGSPELGEIISAGAWFRSEVSFSYPVSDRQWMEGVIDLVIGTKSNELWVIDWKTNQKLPGETDDQFSQSLRGKYLPQLESYRNVLEQGFSRKVNRLLIYSTVLARFV